MARKVTLIIVGLLVALIGAGLMFAGVGLGFLFGSDGRYDSDTGRLETSGHAVVIDKTTLEKHMPFGRHPNTIRVVATSKDPSKQVFLGVGPTDQVDKYLAGSAFGHVTTLTLKPFKATITEVAGQAYPPAPASQPTVWDAQVSGEGRQTLEWDVSSGDYSVAILNADASLTVIVGAQAGLQIPWIFPVAMVALGVGFVVLLIGIAMLSSGIRTKRPPKAEELVSGMYGGVGPLPRPMGGSSGVPVP
jgi:hypothetical protein